MFKNKVFKNLLGGLIAILMLFPLGIASLAATPDKTQVRDSLYNSNCKNRLEKYGVHNTENLKFDSTKNRK